MILYFSMICKLFDDCLFLVTHCCMHVYHSPCRYNFSCQAEPVTSHSDMVAHKWSAGSLCYACVVMARRQMLEIRAHSHKTI